jgi:hypothetical protein
MIAVLILILLLHTVQGEQVLAEGDVPAHERGGEPVPRHTPALLQVHQGEVRQRENRLESHIHFPLKFFFITGL